MKSTNNANLILSKIQVKNLFWRYNYTLDLSPTNDLTIFFGLNGTGKTTILRTIDNLANLRFHEIAEEKFEELIFHFYTSNLDDIHSIEFNISHKNASINEGFFSQEEKSFIIKITKDNESIAQIELTHEQYDILYQRIRENKYFNKTHVNNISNLLDSYYSEPSLEDIMEMNNISEEELTTDDFGDIQTYKLLDEIVEQNDSEHLKLLFKISLSLSCLFISSMRITVNSLTSLSESIEKAKPHIYSIGETKDVEKEKKVEHEERIQIKLNKLKELLFIEAVKEISSKIQDALKFKTLMYKYVQIFQEKVNHFLKYSKKIMECNRSDGIKIKDSKTYRLIPIEKLSSGENNLIIMFYHILFETEANTLVMIDEPEISLHIDWQFDFIDKLLEIQRELKEIKPLMFLITTHSPQILSDHQDRAVDLK